MAKLLAGRTPVTNLWSEGKHAFTVSNVDWKLSKKGDPMLVLSTIKTDDATEGTRRGARKTLYFVFSETPLASGGQVKDISFKNLRQMYPETTLAYWQEFEFPGSEDDEDYSDLLAELVEYFMGYEGVLNIRHKKDKRTGELTDDVNAYLPAGTDTGSGGSGW